MNRLAFAAVVAAALLLSGCANGPTPTTTHSGSTRSLGSPSPSPKPGQFEAYQVGESIKLPSANIVVEGIERVTEIPLSHGQPPYTPNPGERLWFVRMRWTNNAAEAVQKECFGPDTMDLRAFGLDGREMLEVDQPGMIKGNECSTGLMQGQEGVWLTAYRSLDSEFGWLEFRDFKGGLAAVVANPSVQVRFS